MEIESIKCWKYGVTKGSTESQTLISKGLRTDTLPKYGEKSTEH